MTRTSTLMLIAAAALAGCEAETIVTGGPADTENNSAEAASGPVELPPSISASKIYRCADNDVVYVDWLSDGKSANLRTEQNGPPTHLTAVEPGEPMTAAGGYSLSGTPQAASVTIAVPGQAAESCKA